MVVFGRFLFSCHQQTHFSFRFLCLGLGKWFWREEVRQDGATNRSLDASILDVVLDQQGQTLCMYDG